MQQIHERQQLLARRWTQQQQADTPAGAPLQPHIGVAGQIAHHHTHALHHLRLGQRQRGLQQLRMTTDDGIEAIERSEHAGNIAATRREVMQGHDIGQELRDGLAAEQDLTAFDGQHHAEHHRRCQARHQSTLIDHQQTVVIGLTGAPIGAPAQVIAKVDRRLAGLLVERLQQLITFQGELARHGFLLMGEFDGMGINPVQGERRQGQDHQHAERGEKIEPEQDRQCDHRLQRRHERADDAFDEAGAIAWHRRQQATEACLVGRVVDDLQPRHRQLCGDVEHAPAHVLLVIQHEAEDVALGTVLHIGGEQQQGRDDRNKDPELLGVERKIEQRRVKFSRLSTLEMAHHVQHQTQRADLSAEPDDAQHHRRRDGKFEMTQTLAEHQADAGAIGPHPQPLHAEGTRTAPPPGAQATHRARASSTPTVVHRERAQRLS